MAKQANKSRMKLLKTLGITIALLMPFLVGAQTGGTPNIPLNYTNPSTFVVADITVTGVRTIDPNVILSLTGMQKGDEITIPGEEISNAIKKLHKEGFIQSAEISATKVVGRNVYLNIHIVESPRLVEYKFVGLKKGDVEDLEDKIYLIKGKVVTPALLKNTTNLIKQHFAEEGYYNVWVKATEAPIKENSDKVIVTFEVDKNRKVKVEKIAIEGNSALETKKVKRKFKNTKEKKALRVWKRSKYIKDEFEEDKQTLIAYYNSLGYRDARVTDDTVYNVDEKLMNIDVALHEGHQYYIRNIEWEGNYKYDDKHLNKILGIKKGDVYNMDKIESKLSFNPNGADISALYMDDGYLMFNVTPVEIRVVGDSVDIEMRVYEGDQYVIGAVLIGGNTKTNERVIRRELYLRPGEKFSRANLIRSQRELANLGYFNPQTLALNPVPHPEDGTVDIHITVEEKPSDQIQLSMGYGQFFGFVGTLGLQFNNFSLRNIPNVKEWDPLPAGDGQQLSVSVQANANYYQTYSMSFTEPWLGGKKPHSLTVGANYSILSSLLGLNNDSDGKMAILGLNAGLGRRLKWPDDYFQMQNNLSYTNYNLKNQTLSGFQNLTGVFHNVSFNTTLMRNDIDEPFYPTRGTNVSLSLTLTPPYSLVDGKNDYTGLAFEEKYKLVEFHKWMFDYTRYTAIFDKLVLSTRFHMGYVGAYNNDLGVGPFERFLVGGSGMVGFSGTYLLGVDLIGLRGYKDNSIVGEAVGLNSEPQAGIVYNKMVMELRYPITLSPAASIYALTFFEGANNYANYHDYNPFNLYRSTGIGLRLFMPAFGLIGLNYGWAMDEVPGNPTANEQRFTFTIGNQIR